MFLNVVLLLALPERDLCEDLRGPVLGSPLGGLTRNPSGSAPPYGGGTAGRTATFLYVVLLFALPESAGESLDLREDLRGPVLGSPLGGLTRIPSGSAPFLNVVFSLSASLKNRPHTSQVALPERACDNMDLREDY
jgi:hypothetical protein